mmetsp:Transcript_9627/g.27409  ORF Transcript_9627/g.27409 Transcript_9627/m.27409 type:complete len:204 (-) Transcript_9627:180-791(-)
MSEKQEKFFADDHYVTIQSVSLSRFFGLPNIITDATPPDGLEISTRSWHMLQDQIRGDAERMVLCAYLRWIPCFGFIYFPALFVPENVVSRDVVFLTGVVVMFAYLIILVNVTCCYKSHTERIKDKLSEDFLAPIEQEEQYHITMQVNTPADFGLRFRPMLSGERVGERKIINGRVDKRWLMLEVIGLGLFIGTERFLSHTHH